MTDDEFDPMLIAQLRGMPKREVLKVMIEIALESDAYDVAQTALDELKRIAIKEVPP